MAGSNVEFVGLIAAGFFAYGIMGLTVAGMMKPTSNSFVKNKRVALLLTPMLVTDRSRTKPHWQIQQSHRLLSADKKEFLLSETKRGVRGLQIAAEDRL
jgi:hypothetical protein